MITVRGRTRWQGLGIKGALFRLYARPDSKFNVAGEELTEVIDAATASVPNAGCYYFNTEHPDDLFAPGYVLPDDPSRYVQYVIHQKFRRSVIDYPINGTRYAAFSQATLFKIPPKAVIQFPTYTVFDVGWLVDVTENPELLVTPRPFSFADQNVTQFYAPDPGTGSGTYVLMEVTAAPVSWPLIWQPEWQTNLDATWKTFNKPDVLADSTSKAGGPITFRANLPTAERNKPNVTFTVRAFYIPNPSVKSDARSWVIA